MLLFLDFSCFLSCLVILCHYLKHYQYLFHSEVSKIKGTDSVLAVYGFSVNFPFV